MVNNRSSTPAQPGSPVKHPNDNRSSLEQSPSSSDEQRGNEVAIEDQARTPAVTMGTDEGSNDHLTADERAEESDAFDAATLYQPTRPRWQTNAQGSSASIYSTKSVSAYSDRAASTRSLWAQDLDYREIHGRRYCKDYFMPNDETEQLRMTVQHQVFLLSFDGELTFAPLSNPRQVLDVGTGTGEWAIRFAELYPDCEVVGTDIAAIQETRGVPMNVFFEIEDAEEWDRPLDRYDLVHVRCLEGAFRDWKYIYKHAFDSLKPGGWIEVADMDATEGALEFFSCFSEGSPIHQMMHDLLVAGEKSGRQRGIGHLTTHLFQQSGFVDIRPTDHRFNMDVDGQAGKLWLMTWLEGLEAYLLRPLTEYMGYGADEVKSGCQEAAKELAARARSQEKSKSLVIKMCVVVARKPLPGETVGDSA